MNELTSPAAMFKLGKSLYDAENSAAAISWIQKSADKGYVDAMYWLGLRSYIDEDYSAAVEWLQKAAENGSADSKKFLADVE